MCESADGRKKGPCNVLGKRELSAGAAVVWLAS